MLLGAEIIQHIDTDHSSETQRMDACQSSDLVESWW